MTAVADTDAVSFAHLDVLGLKHNPFPVVPDAENFFVPPRLDSIITELVHAMLSRKGFALLSGEVGLGKTTISRRLLAILAERSVRTALILNPRVQEDDLLAAINRDLGLVPAASLRGNLELLNDYLLELYRQGQNCVIVIDDAQNLSVESLELLRLLSNLETGAAKLVQLLLIGQPELNDTLARPELRQLRSRLALRVSVGPYSFEELTAYIDFKLARAGDQDGIRISRAAAREVHRVTGGSPRLTNILLDRALYALLLYNDRTIDRRIVRHAAAELDLQTRGRRRGPGLKAAGAAALTLLLGVGALSGSQRHAVPWERLAGLASAANAEGSSASTAAAPPETPAPSAVARFLGAYELERFTRELEQAVELGYPEAFGRHLYRETGLRFVALQDAPSTDVEARYATLPIDTVNGLRHYLVWRPASDVTTFYKGYRDASIARLQEQLAGLGLYSGAVDGIVGDVTIAAVRELQRRVGLPVTGRPDPLSLFWLEQSSEQLAGLGSKGAIRRSERAGAPGSG